MGDGRMALSLVSRAAPAPRWHRGRSAVRETKLCGWCRSVRLVMQRRVVGAGGPPREASGPLRTGRYPATPPVVHVKHPALRRHGRRATSSTPADGPRPSRGRAGAPAATRHTLGGMADRTSGIDPADVERVRELAAGGPHRLPAPRPALPRREGRRAAHPRRRPRRRHRRRRRGQRARPRPRPRARDAGEPPGPPPPRRPSRRRRRPGAARHRRAARPGRRGRPRLDPRQRPADPPGAACPWASSA